MGYKNTLLFLPILVALISRNAQAEKHVVGGNQGWDASTNFASWASTKTFKVGDQLVFKYSSGLHSVIELANESAYKGCDVGTAIDSKSSGNDVVKLNKPGTRYFTCGTIGHCEQGMKVKIKVVSGGAPSSPASPSTSASPTTDYDTTTSSAFHNLSLTSIFVPLVVSLLATILIFESRFF